MKAYVVAIDESQFIASFRGGGIPGARRGEVTAVIYAESQAEARQLGADRLGVEGSQVVVTPYQTGGSPFGLDPQEALEYAEEQARAAREGG